MPTESPKRSEAVRECHVCDSPMRRTGVDEWVCTNPECGGRKL